MQILTGVINNVDYNDLLPFNNDSAPEHFYLGFNETILYKKSALHDHLIKEHYVLSTFKSSEPRILRGLAVEEIARLTSCVLPIEDENKAELFSGFGEFLQKIVYPQLNVSNELPLEI